MKSLNSIFAVRRIVLKKMLLLTAMYLCQTISVGFVFGSMPVILRNAGVSLQTIGGLFILHLPWALKFLYASWVDRHYIPTLGRRRSWIFPLQWLGALLLLCVSQTPPETHFQIMYVLLLLLNIVMATNDIAVDGYATDILLPGERAWGNTVQSAARYVGMLVGGGLMLVCYDIFNWAICCVLLAAWVFLLSLPALLHQELPPTYDTDGEETVGRRSAGLWSFLRRREVFRLLPVLILPTTFAFTGMQMRLPFFTDLGVDPRTMGGLLFTYAYPVGFVGTLVSGYVLHRCGTAFFLRLFCCVSIGLALFCSCHSFSPQGMPCAAAIALCADNVLVGGIQIWAYTQIMRVSAGPQAGLGFATLSSLFTLAPMLSAPFFGALGDRRGLSDLYLLLGILMAIGYLLTEILLWLHKRRVASSSPAASQEEHTLHRGVSAEIPRIVRSHSGGGR